MRNHERMHAESFTVTDGEMFTPMSQHHLSVAALLTRQRPEHQTKPKHRYPINKHVDSLDSSLSPPPPFDIVILL